MVSSPKVPVAPAPDPLPPPPARTDEETRALADEQRKKYAPKRGSSALNFLTKSGVSSAQTAVQFLGGASGT